MPSLSQNFKFLPNLTTSLDYPDDQTSKLVFFTESVKGRGYYNTNEGLHTIQISLTNFKGAISIQGSLLDNPTSDDWGNIPVDFNYYTIDTTGLIQSNSSFINFQYNVSTGSFSYNITGNYVLLRIKIFEFEQGRINYIRYNY